MRTINQPSLKWWDTGSDNTGKFIENNRDVNNDPDYFVENFGLVEIQFAKPLCEKYFHIKKAKLEKCVNGQAHILMANGWETDDPVYTLINYKQSKVLAARCEETLWFGGKESYRIPTDWLNWQKLK